MRQHEALELRHVLEDTEGSPSKVVVGCVKDAQISSGLVQGAWQLLHKSGAFADAS